MVKSHVKVYIRTRPTSQPYDGVKFLPDGETVTINVPRETASGLGNNQLESHSFKFNGVLHDVSQDSVYSAAAQEGVESTLAGLNSTILCYGQTGAGKTFTMSGDARKYSHRGIVPRAIHQIFREVDMRVDRIYKVQVSYLEIYNETLYDLLSDAPGSGDSLCIMDDNSNTYVRGLTKVEVTNEEEALSQFFIGEQGRSTAAHVLNAASSRSHCIFTIQLEMRHSAEANERALVSKLHLVDLAGSERTKKTNPSGQSLNEANFINKSLTFLQQTVNALSRKDAHVPFRQTKLTAVLRDALGGNCRTAMVANIWCEPQHLEETIGTLRFASRVKLIETEAVVNESADPMMLARRYERQIRELKQELAMRDTLSGRGRVSYEDLTDGELRQLNALAQRFLSGDADVAELPTDSVKHIHEAFKQMRLVYQGLRESLQSQMQAAAPPVGAPQQDVHQATGDADAVGDVDKDSNRGFYIGQAPSHARPVVRIADAQQQPGGAGPNGLNGSNGADIGSPRRAVLGDPALRASFARPEAGVPESCTAAGPWGVDSPPRSPYHGMSAQDGGAGGRRNAAFLRYRKEVEEGVRLDAAVKGAQQQLKELKQKVKDASLAVNQAKRDIDRLSADVDSRKPSPMPAAAAGAAADDVIDSEMYQQLQQLKATKAAYRTGFDQLKDLRSSLQLAVDDTALAKQRLLEAFDSWSGADSTGHTTAQIGALAYEDDELDPGEAFAQSELQRVMASDPDSTAYYAARKKSQTAPTRGPIRAHRL